MRHTLAPPRLIYLALKIEDPLWREPMGCPLAITLTMHCLSLVLLRHGRRDAQLQAKEQIDTSDASRHVARRQPPLALVNTLAASMPSLARPPRM